MTGMETAIWWCEYVIRHKGTKHLKSPATDIPLYKYLHLDVLAVIFISIYLLIKIIKQIILILRNMIKMNIKRNIFARISKGSI